MKLVLATHNKGKIREFSELLRTFFSQISSAAEEGITEEPAETGETFFDNAVIKAKFIAEKLGVCALSDDSGLCVDALGGAPGLHSARYAGEGKGDLANNLKLLETLQGESNRAAHFFSCIVLFNPFNETALSGEGKILGRILEEFDGQKGFGYDPLFFCDELGKSFGRATDEEKNSVSHRRRAVDDLIGKLRESAGFSGDR